MDAVSYEFDAALSFAGEDREYVEEVAEALKAAGMRIFLDGDYQAEMWGEDLVEFFDTVFRKRSRYAVLFLSRHYAAKIWTREERRSALARALEERSAYILPIRLDDTEIVGLRPTLHYLDARRVGIEGIVAALRAKLDGVPGDLVPWPGDRAPRTEREVAQVLSERPPGWEYLYFAGVLQTQLRALEAGYRDHEVGHQEATGEHVSMEAAIPYAQRTLDDLRNIVGSLTGLFEPMNLEKAFGPPGKAGDPDRIRHLGQRLTSAYERLLVWAARVRGASRPGELDQLFALLARFADRPIAEYRAFVEEFTDWADRIPTAMAAETPFRATITLTVSIDTELSEAFTTEAARIFGETVPM
ncbi:MAG: TIR domain-containing protein [Chloroflexi bacterium]|nr:TIR domain-containing protein [Chloroflexota bacterium]